MQDEGKVKGLVKRFTEKPASNDPLPYENEVPTKDTGPKDFKMTKFVTPQGQDEISVTIDIEDDESNHTMPNNVFKSIPQSMNGIHEGVDNAENDGFHVSNYRNQINFSLKPIGQRKDANENQYSKLSPWLSSKINSKNAGSEIQTNSDLKSIGVDTFELNRIREDEIRALKEKIDDLNCQLKIKDREIETSKWIDKEMHKRLQSTEDLFFVKSQVKELQRKLDMIEKQNQDLTLDNERLYDEMRKKDLAILELQSEVDNLDRIIENKKFIHANDENKRILDDIDVIRSELMERDKQASDNQQQLSSLQREMERKSTELHYKNIKVDEIVTELARCQSEMAILDKKNHKILESLNAVEKENSTIKRDLLRFEDFEFKWQELEDENMYLKQTNQDLIDQYKILEKRQDSAYQVSSLLDELRQALIEKNRATEERNHLFEQLRVKDSIVKDKTTEEKALIQDMNQLKKFIRELEEENAMYRKFENECSVTENQLRECEREKNALESQLVQLKPKIQKLQVKSLEKDHLITQLVQELKSQIGYLPSDLRKEISKNEIGLPRNTNQDQPDKDEDNLLPQHNENTTHTSS